MEKRNGGLAIPAQFLKGVGPKVGKLFEDKGIRTVEDLFYFLPLRYEDRRHIVKIGEVPEGGKAVLAGRVVSARSLYFRNSRRKAYEAVIDDGTGTISVKWFKWQPQYLKKVAMKGNLLVLSGEVTRFGATLQMVHPNVTVLDDESEIESAQGIVPVYSEIGSLKQGVIRRLVRQAFQDFGPHVASMVPPTVESSRGLPCLGDAFLTLHFPDAAAFSSSADSSFPSLPITHNPQSPGLSPVLAQRGSPPPPAELPEPPAPAGGYPARFARCLDSSLITHSPSPSSPVFDLSPFLHRLIFEEYFLFQAALLLKRREVKKEQSPMFRTQGKYHTRILRTMPFELTEAQARVTGELMGDMTRGQPMNRLLQGDVGCGKTVCALLATCVALDSGYQVAIMAPTEILAEQHYLTTHRFFEALDIPVALLRGGMGKERGEMLDSIREGSIPVVIGTHALLERDVLFNRLGLVIIDEQHRFGVIQRKRLREKAFSQVEPGTCNLGPASPPPVSSASPLEPCTCNLQPATRDLGPVSSPHVLVMTATPIPRTLAMVVYGDLDVSVIDQMPPGRQAVRTRVYAEGGRNMVYGIIEKEVKKKHQVFVVYPLVEESEKMELADATNMARHFQEDIFPSHRVGLLHGRMKAEDKESVMKTFKKGEIDILVCTTVIEVGIDVPNATVMVVEHAERFGLSQLHQLRGRVGRGAAPARCLLISSAKGTDVAAKRLKVMEETGDGFVVAERDMEIRGPGDMFGVRQAGMPQFRVGSIVRDGHIMTEARRAAEEALALFREDEAEMICGMAAERWGSEADVHDVA